MKQILEYRFFIKSLVYLVLSCQVLVTTVQCDFWAIESSEVIEFSGSEADEEDNKKEQEDTFRVDLIAKKLVSSLFESYNSSQMDCLLIQYSEITTPPPEGFFLKV